MTSSHGQGPASGSIWSLLVHTFLRTSDASCLLPLWCRDRKLKHDELGYTQKAGGRVSNDNDSYVDRALHFIVFSHTAFLGSPWESWEVGEVSSLSQLGFRAVLCVAQSRSPSTSPRVRMEVASFIPTQASRASPERKLQGCLGNVPGTCFHTFTVVPQFPSFVTNSPNVVERLRERPFFHSLSKYRAQPRSGCLV